MSNVERMHFRPPELHLSKGRRRVQRGNSGASLTLPRPAQIFRLTSQKEISL